MGIWVLELAKMSANRFENTVDGCHLYWDDKLIYSAPFIRENHKEQTGKFVCAFAVEAETIEDALEKSISKIDNNPKFYYPPPPYLKPTLKTVWKDFVSCLKK